MKNDKNLYKKIYNWLIAIIIFLVPTNFFLKFFETGAYVNGLMVDYLIPKLYLSDILIIALLLVWFLNWLCNFSWQKSKSWSSFFKKIKILLKENILLLTLTAVIFLRQFWTNHPLSSIVYMLRIIELGLFTKFIIENKKTLNKKIIRKAVLATLFFQSSIAIYQYINQKSLYGYLLLGEPNLNNYIGITKNTLFGIEKILPYGTTAHPNVLGGFLAIYLLYIISRVEWKPKLQTILKYFPSFLIVFFATITLVLTQSISAIITFILGLVLIFYRKHFKKIENIFILISGLIIFSVISLNFLANKYPENQSITRRNYLNITAINMINDNILTGVGLNNFTSEVEKFGTNREIVRFVQPVHNIFLLFFAETGLLGLATLGVLIDSLQIKNKQKSWWWIIILLPIALLDHYLLTLNSGMLLILFSIVFV